MVRVRILCFGNLLAGDDGFGVHVHRRLSSRPLARPGLVVEAVDAGLLGMSALTYFEQCDHVVVVDALGYDGQAGRLRRVELAEISAPASAFSAHALDLNHLFHVLPIVFEGRQAPSVTVVGAEIEPPTGGFCMELSAPLQAAVEHAVVAIDNELDRLCGALSSEARLAM
jgi:hydrogenase maturation protease